MRGALTEAWAGSFGGLFVNTWTASWSRVERRQSLDTLQPAERSARMALVKSRNTRPELEVRKLLWSMGYRCRLNRSDVPGKPDIPVSSGAIMPVPTSIHERISQASSPQRRLPKSRVAFWNEKFKRNVERDRTVQLQLTDFGWRSLAIWECEIKDRAQLRSKIGRFLDAKC